MLSTSLMDPAGRGGAGGLVHQPDSISIGRKKGAPKRPFAAVVLED
jgi:hypothetical protein